MTLRKTATKKRSFNPQKDDKNWKLLFEKHFQDLQSLNAISPIWISGLSKLGMNHDMRPLAQQLTDAIQPYTGYTFIQTDENEILEQKCGSICSVT